MVNYLFEDDFDDGDFDGWSPYYTGDATIEIDTKTKSGEGYSVELWAGNEEVIPGWGADLYYQALNWDKEPNLIAVVTILVETGEGQDVTLNFTSVPGGNLQCAFAVNAAGSDLNYEVVLDQWYVFSIPISVYFHSKYEKQLELKDVQLAAAGKNSKFHVDSIGIFRAGAPHPENPILEPVSWSWWLSNWLKQFEIPIIEKIEEPKKIDWKKVAAGIGIGGAGLIAAAIALSQLEKEKKEEKKKREENASNT